MNDSPKILTALAGIDACVPATASRGAPLGRRRRRASGPAMASLEAAESLLGALAAEQPAALHGAASRPVPRAPAILALPDGTEIGFSRVTPDCALEPVPA